MKKNNEFVNNNKFLVVQLFFCILITVSPLLPQYIKLLIALLLVFINFGYLSGSYYRNVLLLCSAIFIFLTSFIIDYSRYGLAAFEEPLSIYFSFCFILGFIMSQRVSLKNFFEVLDFIVFPLAVVSLVLFSLVFINQGAVNYFFDYNYYHTTHKTLFLHNYLISDGEVVLRNSGVASEPGLYQIIVSLGFFSYLYLNKKYSFIKFSLYSIALVSTFSTAGLMSFVLLLMYSVRSNFKILFFVLLFLVLFNGFFISYILFHFEYKLLGSYAFDTRLDPLLYSFNILKNDFYGIGNAGITLNEIGDRISFESFGQIAARYGYPMLFWFVIVLAILFDFSFVFFALIVLFLTTQLVWFSPLMTMLYFLVSKTKADFVKSY